MTMMIVPFMMVMIMLVSFGGIKPDGEYDCGERSANLTIEQERIVCENQHYDITGKNRTIINGIETYCCPSPWLPNDDKTLGFLGPAD